MKKCFNIYKYLFTSFRPIGTMAEHCAPSLEIWVGLLHPTKNFIPILQLGNTIYKWVYPPYCYFIRITCFNVRLYIS